MQNITIYHNPKCSKSREALAYIEDTGAKFETIKYLDADLSTSDIRDLLNKLGISPRELMRTKEEIYKELDLASVSDEETLIEAMAKHPKLIERPIIIKGERAIIGRPPSLVVEFIA
ncbi:MAG: arsenate reductase (glutaredoxin) [Sulfuricurvum sp.]